MDNIKIGGFSQTEAELKQEKTADINADTENKILNAMNVDNKTEAIIKQLNEQGKALAFLVNKLSRTKGVKFTKKESKLIAQTLGRQQALRDIIKSGKAAKNEL